MFAYENKFDLVLHKLCARVSEIEIFLILFGTHIELPGFGLFPYVWGIGTVVKLSVVNGMFL